MNFVLQFLATPRYKIKDQKEYLSKRYLRAWPEACFSFWERGGKNTFFGVCISHFAGGPFFGDRYIGDVILKNAFIS